ncbi:MAG: hypothetical protein ACRYFS_19690 [Janthinobacterium lividum]
MTEPAKNQPEDQRQDGQITILADYFSLANEIIQPDQYVSTSRYFCLKWEPSLGLVGARIIRVLRSLGYYNRQTGEMRDGIPIDLPELAALCGFSVATIKREFGSGKDGKPANPSLHTFVQREKNYKHDAVTGQIWREENIYRVKMDDPVHPDDLPRLQQLWESRQKGGKAKNDSGGPAKPPSQSPANRKAQNDPYGSSNRKAQSEPNGNARRAHPDSKSNQDDSEPNQSAPQLSQLDSKSVQNEPTLIDFSCFPENPLNSSSDVSEGSLSLFQEERKGLLSWKALSEADQLPWRDQARRELVAIHAGSGITPKPMLVEVRAKNLYEVSLREIKL